MVEKPQRSNMQIVSTKDCLGGQPRLDNHRIQVSYIVNFLEQAGSLKTYIKWFPTVDDPKKIREALDYCRNEQCIGNCIAYCQGCTKNTSPEITDNPEKGIHVLGDVPLEEALQEWDLAGKVLVVGDPEEPRDLWKVAAILYEQHFR